MLRMRQKDIKVLFVETQFYHLVSLFYLVHSYNTYQSNPIWGLMDEHGRSGGRGRCCLQLTQFTEDLWPLSFLISQDYFGRLSILLSYHLQEWLVAWGGTLQFKIAAIGQISAFLLLDGCSFICSIVYLHIYLYRQQQLYVQTNFSSRALPVQWPDESKRRRWMNGWYDVEFDLQIWKDPYCVPLLLRFCFCPKLSNTQVIAIRPMIYVPFTRIGRGAG